MAWPAISATSRRSPLRTQLLLAVLIAAAAVGTHAGESWPGFRGQHRQAVGSAAHAPLRWSPTEHVRWKTPIHGSGHSSPVVAGDQVFVTTAYQSETARQVLGYARGVRIALSLLVLVLAFLLPRPTSSWQYALAAAALAVLVVLAVADEQLLQFERSAARRWLGAICAALVGLTLSAYGLPPDSRGRRIVALGVTVLGVMLIAGMPNGFHQTLPIIGALAVIVTAAATSGWLLLRGLFAGTHPGSAGAIYASGVVTAAAALFLRPIIGPTVALFVVAAVVLAMGLRARFGARPNVLFAWRGAVLVNTAAGLLTATVLVPHTGWKHAVAAVDRETGELRWIRAGITAPAAAVHRANSLATPTAVADRERVIAYFGTPGLMAVSSTGTLLWTNRDVPFQSIYGVGASPVLAPDAVLVSSFTAAGPYLAAFDPGTGREKWRTSRPDVHPEFGDSRTPLLATLQGRPMVVVWGIDELAGHDLETGHVLWKYLHGANHRMGSMVASILADGDLLFLPLENGMIALSVTRLAAGVDPVVWTSRGGGSALTTPVLYDGRIYAVSSAGIATCTEASTGELLWRARLSGEYHSSPIAVGGHVYFTDAAGKTTIVVAGPTFEMVRENEIGEPVVATLAPVDGDLYIRGRHHLFRITR